MSNPVVDTLYDQYAIWKSATLPSQHVRKGLGTGFPALDASLPGQGWPEAVLTELLADRTGIGELSLLLPALASLSRRRGVMLIAPPFVPYAPALVEAGVDLARLLVISSCGQRDALACGELALRSGACGAVLLWENGMTDAIRQSIAPLALRRLHLAADRGRAMAVLFRAARQAVQPSPAALRILLRHEADGLGLTLFKRRGMFGEAQLMIDPYLSSLRTEIACLPEQRRMPFVTAAHAGQPIPAEWLISPLVH
jgi:protein ImuA